MAQTLRTPDDCFSNLPDYPFAPHYVDLDGLRIHYLDEGPADAPNTVLMLHGEPTWSYLYRKMIPIVAGVGHRVIAPDLIGFGKSDKLTDPAAYSYQSHIDWVTAFIKTLDLTTITLVCQDWGGLLGLRLAAENPDRFTRICAANTFLPTGDQPAGEAFRQWQQFSQTVPVFATGNIVNGGCVRTLTLAEVAAYDAPFPDESYKVAARQFPLLVPTTPTDPAASANRAAWQVLLGWQKPFLTCFSDKDPITAGADKVLQKLIPGAANQRHITLANGGHFVQEDCGEAWAEAIVGFMKE